RRPRTLTQRSVGRMLGGTQGRRYRMTTTTFSNDAPAGASHVHAARVRTLDDLAALGSDELDRLYRDAPAPTGVERLAGRPRGRMLAVRHTDGTPLFGLLRAFASSNAFPWD